MSKLMASLSSFILIFGMGCAMAPEKYISQKEVNRAAIERISKVEIFYHPSEYSVIDLGGSKAAEMSGGLGIVGMFLALTVHAASKLTVVERAEARSKEFNQLAQADQVADINAVQAQQLGALIQATGREVKLTMLSRLMGGRTLATSTNADLKFTQGYAPLLLRVTTGYVAESATASYKSLALTEFALLDGNIHDQVLVASSIRKRDNGTTYQTFDGLKLSRAMAVESLKKDLEEAAQLVFKETFAPIEAVVWAGSSAMRCGT